MLDEGLAIRFADKNKVVPNMEIKFVKDELDKFSMKEKIEVVIKGGSVFVSDIALQIAYKKYVLGSNKDLEDARHLQKLFDFSDEDIRKHKIILKQYGRL